MKVIPNQGEAVGVGRVRAALSWEPPVQDLARMALATPTLAALLLLLTFPLVSFLPRTGPDPSWQAGLYMALEGGIPFGREFVFTYGPLGFLHAPVLYGEGLFLVSVGFTVAARLALALALLWTARRSLPLPLAFGVCYFALVVGHLNSVLILVVFLWAFAALDRTAPEISPRLLACGGGAIAAIELLAKLNYGVSILVLCLIALAALPARRRNVSLLVATFVASLLALWLGTGQNLTDLPAFISHSLQIASGYSQAMGVDIDTKPHDYLIALGATAIVVVAAVIITRRDRRAVRWASLLLLGFFLYAVFKQDFIRRGIEGRNDFALMLMAAAIAVAARLPSDGRLPRQLVAMTLVAPMMLIVVWANPLPSFLSALAPQEHLVAAREELDIATSPSLREAERNAARRAMRTTYSVPPAILRRIGDRAVAVEPWEIGVAWAYGLNWRPLPVIQDYSAYTSALDHLNAAALGDGGGPELILRQGGRDTALLVESVDGRYPAWDPPAVSLALLCNYESVAAQGQWQLVEKTADRCGPPRPLATTNTETGRLVNAPSAPRPDEVVFARIEGLEPDLGEKAAALLYRAPLGWVSFDGGERWNLDTATAGDGLIVSAPAAVDYRHPFRLAPDPRSFKVGIDGAGARPITVSFYSQRVEPRRATVGPPRAGSPKG